MPTILDLPILWARDMLKMSTYRIRSKITPSINSLITKRFNQFKAPFLEKKREGNYQPLSIISLLNASALHYPSKIAYVHGDQNPVTWGTVASRIRRFSSALSGLGVREGDVVSIIAPNSPSIFEAHFSIPGCNGAVIHTVNTRLDAVTIAFQLKHSKAKVLIVDAEFGSLAKEAIKLLPKEVELPIIIDVLDPEYIRLNSSPSSITLCGSLFIFILYLRQELQII